MEYIYIKLFYILYYSLCILPITTLGVLNWLERIHGLKPACVCCPFQW